MNARLALVLLCVAGVAVGCATRPETPASREHLSAQVRETIALFKVRDPGIESFFERSYAYAVLPRITKGAVIVGGAYGKGEVFARGTKIGHCSMSQASVGFSFGGEYFREIIFFREKGHLDLFRAGDFTFSGQVTAVALTRGAATKNDYQDGMAVFVMADAGLMVDASLAGQKFSFEPAFIMREEPPTILP